MKKRALFSLLIALPFINTCDIISTSGASNTISGYVVKNGEPAPDFNVQFFQINTIHRARTDNNGFFQLKRLPPGVGSILISKVQPDSTSLFANGNIFVNSSIVIDTLRFPDFIRLSGERDAQNTVRLTWNKTTLENGFRGYAIYRSTVSTIVEGQDDPILIKTNPDDTVYVFPSDLTNMSVFFRVFHGYGDEGVVRGATNTIRIDYPE